MLFIFCVIIYLQHPIILIPILVSVSRDLLIPVFFAVSYGFSDWRKTLNLSTHPINCSIAHCLLLLQLQLASGRRVMLFFYVTESTCKGGWAIGSCAALLYTDWQQSHSLHFVLWRAKLRSFRSILGLFNYTHRKDWKHHSVCLFALITYKYTFQTV